MGDLTEPADYRTLARLLFHASEMEVNYAHDFMLALIAKGEAPPQAAALSWEYAVEMVRPWIVSRLMQYSDAETHIEDWGARERRWKSAINGAHANPKEASNG